MQLQSLQEIFNAKIFRIPDYQRGYSWGEPQWEDLWRDLDILEDGRYHYTGVLSVNAGPGYLVYVIDGQQRITSLVILIHALCQKLDDDTWIGGDKNKHNYIDKYLYSETEAGKEVVFGYEEDNPSHIYFKTQILGLADTDKSVPNRTLYTKNLQSAKEFFADKVNGLDTGDLKSLLIKITERLKFNCYQLDEELNQFVVFEAMNNRGKPLSNLELLKNRLIYLTTLLQEDQGKIDKLRKDINRVWKTVYEFLGKNPNKSLDDNTFLMHHWIIYFGKYTRHAAQPYKDFLLDKHFTTENIQKKEIQASDIEKYVVDLQNVVEHYYYMLNPGDTECPYSEEIVTWLHKVKRLEYSVSSPLIAAALIRHKNNGGDGMVRLLKAVERFAFVAFNVNLARSNKGNTNIYNHAYNIHRESSSLTDVISELEELQAWDISIDHNKLIAGVAEKSEKFSKWKGLRYFLYEYELHLHESCNGQTQLVEWDSIEQKTIEHIYPKNPSAGWDKFASEEACEHLHDLGNLLLLSCSLNSKLSNKPYKEKKPHFKKLSYSAMEVADEHDWTPKHIRERQDRMLNFLKGRWGLE